jgi:hypothetical protein
VSAYAATGSVVHTVCANESPRCSAAHSVDMCPIHARYSDGEPDSSSRASRGVLGVVKRTALCNSKKTMLVSKKKKKKKKKKTEVPKKKNRGKTPPSTLRNQQRQIEKIQFGS